MQRGRGYEVVEERKRGVGRGIQGTSARLAPLPGPQDRAGRAPSAPPPEGPVGTPSLSGAWFVTCLPEDEGRNRKERAGWTGKSSWAGYSPWLHLAVEAEALLALPPRHMRCWTLGSPSSGLAAIG